MGKAINDLKKEHDAILHVLRLMERIRDNDKIDDSVRFRTYSDLVYFLRIFADKCHHGKEEGILFKELENAGIPNEGGPIGVMLAEHVQGREYIGEMASALETNDFSEFNEALAMYSDLLRNHIDKENNVLFVMADKLLDVVKQDEIFEKFEQHEEEVIGHGVHEELHMMIHRWDELPHM